MPSVQERLRSKFFDLEGCSSWEKRENYTLWDLHIAQLRS